MIDTVENQEAWASISPFSLSRKEGDFLFLMVYALTGPVTSPYNA